MHVTLFHMEDIRLQGQSNWHWANKRRKILQVLNHFKQKEDCLQISLIKKQKEKSNILSKASNDIALPVQKDEV